MRTIKVWSGLTNELVEFESESRYWKELRGEFDKQGVAYKGMKVIIGQTQTTIESEDSVIPEGDVNIFLTQQKSKAGADVDSMGYWDLRETIAELRNESEEAREHFGNYTNLNTDALRNLLAGWNSDDCCDDEVEVMLADLRATLEEAADNIEWRVREILEKCDSTSTPVDYKATLDRILKSFDPSITTHK